MSDFEIIDNVLPQSSFDFLSDVIRNSNVWNLDMYSNERTYKIPGRILFDNTIQVSGEKELTSLLAFVYTLIKSKSKSPLSDTMVRLHLGAKPPLMDDDIHTDGTDNEYTVLYYTNKEWNDEWGGQTIVNDKMIEYKPNRAVIYKSNVLHGGKGPTHPILRTYVNYVVKGK
jgi:hypothetical protein